MIYVISDQPTPKVTDTEIAYTLRTLGGGKEMTIATIDEYAVGLTIQSSNGIGGMGGS